MSRSRQAKLLFPRFSGGGSATATAKADALFIGNPFSFVQCELLMPATSIDSAS